MPDTETPVPKNCMIDGRCQLHDVEIERRKSDREDLKQLKLDFRHNNLACESKVGNLHDRITGLGTDTNRDIARNGNLITGVFVSLGLIAVIVLGSFYYTNVVDKRNDRGEEILLTKINADYRSSKLEREYLVSQVVGLLQSSAEQREWQRGVIRQLELINSNINRTLGGSTKNSSEYHYDGEGGAK